MIKKFDEHELVEKVISKLKEISYILEDVTGFIVQYDDVHSRYTSNSLFRIVVSNKYLLDKLYSKHRHLVGLSRANMLDAVEIKFKEDIKNSEYWKEYIDRAKQILFGFGLGLEIAQKIATPMFSGMFILSVHKLSPRQKRRLYKQD